MFCGMDLSLTRPAICFYSTNTKLKENVISSSYESKSKGMERNQEYFKKIIDEIRLYKPVLVCLEGYSFQSKGANVHGIYEFTGILKYKLFLMKIPFISVAPSSLKKFVTSNGHAEKDMMLLSTYKQFGYEFKNNDECDAFGLSYFAACYYAAKNNIEYPNKIKKLQMEIVQKFIERENENGRLKKRK